MQDIKPPTSPSSTVDYGPASDNVPVKKPAEQSGISQPADNPISTDSRTMAQFSSEAEMDKILSDINQKVKSSQNQDESKKGLLRFFKKNKNSKSEKLLYTGHNSPPIPTQNKKRKVVPIVIIAVIVSLSLAGFSFAAFSGQNNSTNQSNKNDSSTANSSVKTDDLDQLVNDIDNQINALSKTQDFNPEALSDTNLGL